MSKFVIGDQWNARGLIDSVLLFPPEQDVYGSCLAE